MGIEPLAGQIHTWFRDGASDVVLISIGCLNESDVFVNSLICDGDQLNG